MLLTEQVMGEKQNEVSIVSQFLTPVLVQVRKGEAPRVLAVLNSFLLALLDFLGVRNVPKQMRLFDAQPLLAVRLLLGSLLIFK